MWIILIRPQCQDLKHCLYPRESPYTLKPEFPLETITILMPITVDYFACFVSCWKINGITLRDSSFNVSECFIQLNDFAVGSC